MYCIGSHHNILNDVLQLYRLITSSLTFSQSFLASEVLGKAVSQMFPPAQRYLLARHRAIYERPEVPGVPERWDYPSSHVWKMVIVCRDSLSLFLFENYLDDPGS